MTKNDLKDLDRRLQALSERVDRVIAKEKPIKPDRSRGKVRLDDSGKKVRNDTQADDFSTESHLTGDLTEPVATGDLAGREMKLTAKQIKAAKKRGTGYSPGIVEFRGSEHGPGCPCGCEGVHDIESAFDAFERECTAENLLG